MHLAPDSRGRTCSTRGRQHASPPDFQAVPRRRKDVHQPKEESHERVQASQVPEDVGGRRRCRGRTVHLGQARARAVEQHAGEGREAARAALEALRPGRRGRVHGERQDVPRQVRHRGARRQRGLGGRATEGRGGREHRRRPRHHPVDQRRRESVSGQARRRDRRLRLPRREVRRLVPGVRSVPAARRQEMDRRAAGRGRRRDGLPRERASRRPASTASRRTPTASSSCARR